MEEIDCLSINEFFVEENCSPVGEGGFGEVWDAFHFKYRRVAVKIFPAIDNLENFKKEVMIQAKANKVCNGIPVRGIITFRIHRNIYGIVSDFMPGGDLRDFIHGYQQPRRIYEWCLAFRILHEISNAMRMLHHFSSDMRIIHGDLKPGNILFDGDLHAKLCDFGTAKFVTVSTDLTANHGCNNTTFTMAYTPLEFFNNARRTTSYDVYSFCVLAWELLSQRRPFQDCSNDPKLIKAQLESGGLMNSVEEINVEDHEKNEILKSLLRSGLDNIPQNRPSFGYISEQLKQLIVDVDYSMDSAVISAKHKIMERKRITSFDATQSNYSKALADLYTTQPPQSDSSILNSRTVDDPSLLTDSDCIRLGQKLYYSDGWELLARRFGLSFRIIESIKDDHRTSVLRKTAMFREWCRQNRPDKTKLVELLYINQVSFDCFEFLDPDRKIMQSL